MKVCGVGTLNYYQYANSGVNRVRPAVDEYKSVEPDFNTVLMDECIKAHNKEKQGSVSRQVKPRKVERV